MDRTCALWCQASFKADTLSKTLNPKTALDEETDQALARDLLVDEGAGVLGQGWIARGDPGGNSLRCPSFNVIFHHVATLDILERLPIVSSDYNLEAFSAHVQAIFRRKESEDSREGGNLIEDGVEASKGGRLAASGGVAPGLQPRRQLPPRLPHGRIPLTLSSSQN